MPQPPPHHLHRVITLWPLLFNGLGVIVGAGIYVAIGAVIERAGDASPLSFLLAGIPAVLTGLCYAELAGRFPEASGSVAYVRHGFGSQRLAQLTGAAMTFAVAISAASIALGAVHYLAALVPLPPPLMVVLLVGGFTGIAMYGVGTGVRLAAAMGVIEIAGLVAATVAGLVTIPPGHAVAWVPLSLIGWQGAFAGAFIAFFAFIGFETMVNLAEEVKTPQRTLPLAILGAVGASLVLYIAVASAVVLADSPVGNPLLGLFDDKGAQLFAAVASIAVANGVLVQIIMLARMFYGMAGNAQLPAVLRRVDPRTGSPRHATLLAGGIILAVALMVPFERLLAVTNTVALGVFTLVNLALWRVQRRAPAGPGVFTVSRWVPPAAALSALALLGAEILR